MSDQVYVKPTDMIAARSLLQLLSESVAGMKKTLVEKKDVLSEKNVFALHGAVEALTDLHNMILQQIGESRSMDEMMGDNNHGGKFDA